MSNNILQFPGGSVSGPEAEPEVIRAHPVTRHIVALLAEGHICPRCLVTVMLELDELALRLGFLDPESGEFTVTPHTPEEMKTINND